uniref:Uncharacterized protein n=1 Tax=Globodera rostochiensis TaxID=31243 RepID=A0A914IF58_GLORO
MAAFPYEINADMDQESVDLREHNAEYVIDQRLYNALIPRCLTHRDRDEFDYEGLDSSDFVDPTEEGDRICLVSIRARGVDSRQELRSFFLNNSSAICTRYNCVFSFHELPLHEWDIAIVKFLGNTKLKMWDPLLGHIYEILKDFEDGRVPSQILANSDSPPALDENE